MPLTREMQGHLDMLQGNINRMCVTDDLEELNDMREWAKYRIDRLFDIREDQILKGQV